MMWQRVLTAIFIQMWCSVSMNIIYIGLWWLLRSSILFGGKLALSIWGEYLVSYPVIECFTNLRMKIYSLCNFKKKQSKNSFWILHLFMFNQAESKNSLYFTYKWKWRENTLFTNAQETFGILETNRKILFIINSVCYLYLFPSQASYKVLSCILPLHCSS